MIIKLKGGLGNQMFQYALGKLLQEKYNIRDVTYDDSYIRNIRNTKPNWSGIDGLNTSYSIASETDLLKIHASKYIPNTSAYRFSVWLDCMFNKTYYFEKNRAYIDPKELVCYRYLDGYWQSYRNVAPIRAQLMEDFKTREGLSQKSCDYINEIKNQEAVMVGIRLGDYEKYKKHYFQSDNEYYNAAMEVISKKISSPKFIIFTNNIKKCKLRYKFDFPVIYRENQDYVNDYEELQIMRSCRHAIIAGSTFHWWGAWLIENPNKIIVRPPMWFIDGKPIDIVPPEWITVKYNNE